MEWLIIGLVGLVGLLNVAVLISVRLQGSAGKVLGDYLDRFEERDKKRWQSREGRSGEALTAPQSIDEELRAWMKNVGLGG